MKPERTSAQVRARLVELVDSSRTTATALSRMLGRPGHYLGRFLRDGRPDRLDDKEIDRLAAFFGIDAYELGGRVNLRKRD